MIAATRAGMPPVDHEFIGAKADLAGFLIHRFRGRHDLGPGVGGVDIDLDHPRIGRDADHVQARVIWWPVPFDMHGQAQFGGSLFGGGDEFKVILNLFHRRHEHAQAPVAGFNRNGGANSAANFTDHLFHPVLHRLGRRETGNRGQGCEVGQGTPVVERIGRIDLGIAGGGHMRQ